jgi:hypothetical protein
MFFLSYLMPLDKSDVTLFCVVDVDCVLRVYVKQLAMPFEHMLSISREVTHCTCSCKSLTRNQTPFDLHKFQCKTKQSFFFGAKMRQVLQRYETICSREYILGPSHSHLHTASHTSSSIHLSFSINQKEKKEENDLSPPFFMQKETKLTLKLTSLSQLYTNKIKYSNNSCIASLAPIR